MNTKHTIYHGDCLKRILEIPDKSINLIVSSPPYFNAKDYSSGEGNIGNNKDYESYLEVIKILVKELYRVTIDGGIICWNTSPILMNGFRYMIPYEMYNIFIEQGFICRDEIVWAKPDGAGGLRCGGWVQNNGKPMTWHPNIVDERIQVFLKPGKRSATSEIYQPINTYYEERPKDLLTDIWKMNPETNTKWHPAPFCKELAKRCILLYSFEGDTILDPFLGSGTTMTQAIELNRNSIGIELSEEYIIRSKARLLSISSKDWEFEEK